MLSSAALTAITDDHSPFDARLFSILTECSQPLRSRWLLLPVSSCHLEIHVKRRKQAGFRFADRLPLDKLPSINQSSWIHLALLQARWQLGQQQGAVNICSGEGVTVRQLAERIADEYGRRDLLRFGARPENIFDPPRIVGVREDVR